MFLKQVEGPTTDLSSQQGVGVSVRSESILRAAFKKKSMSDLQLPQTLNILLFKFLYFLFFSLAPSLPSSLPPFFCMNSAAEWF